VNYSANTGLSGKLINLLSKVKDVRKKCSQKVVMEESGEYVFKSHDTLPNSDSTPAIVILDD
jgi:hypothetical protein